MDVQAAGGGIHFTTEKTRVAEKEKLLDDFLQVRFREGPPLGNWNEY